VICDVRKEFLLLYCIALTCDRLISVEA